MDILIKAFGIHSIDSGLFIFEIKLPNIGVLIIGQIEIHFGKDGLEIGIGRSVFFFSLEFGNDDIDTWRLAAM